MMYTKPACTYGEQLQILKDRGLIIPDESFALHCLKHLNYYRLSAYRFPLAVQGNPDQFLPGVTFSDLWELYHFDRTLRRLVLDAAKRVEISIRSRWAYVLGHKYGPQAYEDVRIFRNSGEHQRNLSKLDTELTRSREDFVQHFRRKYGLARPPTWAVCEICSLGQISHFYKTLRDRQDRKAIADVYGIDERVLTSFLHHLTVVRNHAAHHGRIWNRKFVIKFAPPSYPANLAANFAVAPESERRIYNTLTMLIHLLETIEPVSHLPGQIYQHIERLNTAYHPQMGFPADWQSRRLWTRCCSQ